MSLEAAERLAQALLFEGYVLYPYRASSLKNRQRWPFGTLYPPDFCASAREGDASFMQTECLVTGERAKVLVAVRYLQLLARGQGGSGSTDSWHEAIERRVEPEELSIAALCERPRVTAVNVASARLESGDAPLDQADLRAQIVVSAERLAVDLHKITVGIRNESTTDIGGENRAAAQLRSLVSTHTLLSCRGGRFVSLLEPAPEHAAHAAACKNVGTWPVLVGTGDRNDTMLSSPIILYDHPTIAAESRGDLFDATEVDEILSLRILTLTESERREVLATDPRARALLERTEALGESEILALHGIWRAPPSTESPENTGCRKFRPGDHVVLRPRPGGDVLDLALFGEAATISGIEEDMEGRIYYTVTVDADPGRDLGELGQPGHRFFFEAEDLEFAS